MSGTVNTSVEITGSYAKVVFAVTGGSCDATLNYSHDVVFPQHGFTAHLDEDSEPSAGMCMRGTICVSPALKFNADSSTYASTKAGSEEFVAGSNLVFDRGVGEFSCWYLHVPVSLPFGLKLSKAVLRVILLPGSELNDLVHVATATSAPTTISDLTTPSGGWTRSSGLGVIDIDVTELVKNAVVSSAVSELHLAVWLNPDAATGTAEAYKAGTAETPFIYVLPGE